MSWLSRLILGSKNAEPKPDARREAAASAPTVDEVTGEEALVAHLRRELIAGRDIDLGAASALAGGLCARGEYETARPLLDALTRSPAHRARAHAMLAHADTARGELEAARRHWAAVVAYDFDYPGARAALGALRADARSTTLATSETLLGFEEVRAGVGDRYRLRRELGRGASGTVYVAYDERLERQVALKLLHPAAADRVEEQSWLATKRVATLSHPNIIFIYDIDEQRRAITMELCAGGSLADTLARGPLPLRAALGRAVELTSALALVHEAGIAHGDVKPANLFLRDETPDADLVLSDFGITGTLAYMPSDTRTTQAATSPPSDIYASAVVLLEMLHGTTALAPLVRDSAAILRGEARWNGALPSTANAVSAPLRTLLSNMLAPVAADRPCADQVRVELAKLRDTTPP